MATFDELRLQLQASRAAAAKARADAAVARERLARLKERETALLRSFDPQNRQHVRERERLKSLIADAEAKAAGTRDAAGRLKGVEAGAIGVFADATSDPRKGIAEMSNQFPILMLPVRLETRFKRDTPRPQLWVRIYPDDCSVDSFEPTLSENEIKDAKLYWSGIRAAGGITDQERGAWRGLAGSRGSGRAEWIIGHYEPLPPETPADAPPSKSAADDLILVIATETPPPEAERIALRAYWTAFVAAGENAAAAATARNAFIAAVGGEDRAAELLAAYEPFNLDAKRTEGATVATTFVAFPKSEDLDVNRHSWARAAEAALLPDRFVFIGYIGGVEQVFEVGRPVLSPLIVTPDPEAPQNEQLRHDDQGELIVPDELKWLVDFERAVAVGMGFRIDLNADQAARGFDRVIVAGLRLSSNETEAKAELEQLITNHRFSRGGLAIVPQGTPTNNTDTGPSGFSRTEDPDASFDDLGRAQLFTETANWLDKPDGQWLAEHLGLSTETFWRVRNGNGRDQADARAMNVALWPATLGYWMETMMSPVFSATAVDETRDFFNRHILGRGALPAIRIRKQPYGILPATAFSRMQWLSADSDTGARLTHPGRLYNVLRLMDEDWRAMANDVSFAGRSGDPHRILLDIIGLHPGSVEFAQRYAESIEQLYNRLSISGLGGFLSALIIAGLQQRGQDLLQTLGMPGDAVPDMLKKFFLRGHNELRGPLIDDRPLSETEPIRNYTDDDQQNYLEWLIDAANTSITKVYEQSGFKDDKPPRALLYLMLRHALQLGYHDTSLRLFEAASLLDATAVQRAKRDDPFLHVRQQPLAAESRYEILFQTQSVVTGDPAMPVGDFIAKSFATLAPARYLSEQVDALKRLQDASTARLERAFAEHIDCCSYRLDAWLLGLVHFQLATMRGIRDDRTQPAAGAPQTRQGIYLGAYAWLEDLRPDDGALIPFEPRDPGLARDFADGPPLFRDTENQGYIHAPSLNHGVAAAVLRNGYITNAGRDNAQTLAVNLTSERVRTALAIMEGIRGGQSLSALLGYQFERGLHDRHAFGVEVDQFIFKLRREFPLQSNKLRSTRRDEDDVAVEDIEARNVIDGLALVNHMRASGNTTYNFGKIRLPDASAAQAAAINAEAERLIETYDAVADLALAEGVYQAVLGNYDRVASTLDAFSKGNFPPEPQIVRTPYDGLGLTHRVGLHLQPGADPNTSPVAGLAPTPRALAEPAGNQWVASLLPPLDQIACMVTYHEAASNTPGHRRQVTLRDLDLQPADVLVLLRDDSSRIALNELDERINRFVAAAARPDLPIVIDYMSKDTAAFTLFEVLALVRHLRRLLREARPLRATDLALTNEATPADDATEFVDRTRIALVHAALGDAAVAGSLIANLTAFAATIEGPLSDLATRRGEILANADTYVDTLASLLARAAEFSIPQSGWAFAYDYRAGIFRSVIEKAEDIAARWTERLAEYDTLIIEYEALPPAALEERFALLTRAEGLVSTSITTPLPADPDDYRTPVDAKRGAFATRRDAFAALRETTRARATVFLDDMRALLPLDPFERFDVSVEEEENATVRFAEEALSVVQVVLREANRRWTAADALLDEHHAATTAAARVTVLQSAAKTLLGDDFAVIPEFSLGAAQGSEVASAFAGSASLLDHFVGDLDTPLPVDTWMYGAARVRERIRDWEQIVMLAGALGRPEPDLTPLQLPFVAGDRWLALELPPNADLETERLLYTAHFSAGFDRNTRQCGLLLDEWTEVIPAGDGTTGVAFHYDRPNNEAPQTMLLVTPTSLRGAWQWADLVDALNETLDLAKRRAVEPVHVDRTAYAQFLPATVMAVTMRQLTISANLALNNNLFERIAPND